MFAIGIDAVEIERFTHWHTYQQKKVLRIFNDVEVAYCHATQHIPTKAQRFAAHFATKEAAFKVLYQFSPVKKIPFLYFCKQVTIQHTSHGMPYITLTESLLHDYFPHILPTSLTISMSLTHTAHMAIANVVILHKE